MSITLRYEAKFQVDEIPAAALDLVATNPTIQHRFTYPELPAHAMPALRLLSMMFIPTRGRWPLVHIRLICGRLPARSVYPRF